MITHPIPPVFDQNSEILILGSFPSVRSREAQFFYGHPQNRFWRVISAVYGCTEPLTTEQKREFLLSNRIALWDVIASCDIVGSSDSSIKNVVANDLTPLLVGSKIKTIFVNGKTALRYYDKYIKSSIGREAVCLPSTSPANAAWSQDSLIAEWQQKIKQSTN